MVLGLRATPTVYILAPLPALSLAALQEMVLVPEPEPAPVQVLELEQEQEQEQEEFVHEEGQAWPTRDVAPSATARLQMP